MVRGERSSSDFAAAVPGPPRTLCNVCRDHEHGPGAGAISDHRQLPRRSAGSTAALVGDSCPLHAVRRVQGAGGGLNRSGNRLTFERPTPCRLVASSRGKHSGIPPTSHVQVTGRA
jgi:hypothetical protein